MLPVLWLTYLYFCGSFAVSDVLSITFEIRAAQIIGLLSFPSFEIFLWRILVFSTAINSSWNGVLGWTGFEERVFVRKVFFRGAWRNLCAALRGVWHCIFNDRLVRGRQWVLPMSQHIKTIAIMLPVPITVLVILARLRATHTFSLRWKCIL